MSAPNYLARLREINQGNMRQGETAQTAKINLRSLCSSPLAHFQEVSVPPPTASTDNTAAPFDQEWYEERAAIYEFDAGFSRDESERRAYLEVTQWLH